MRSPGRCIWYYQILQAALSQIREEDMRVQSFQERSLVLRVKALCREGPQILPETLISLPQRSQQILG